MGPSELHLLKMRSIFRKILNDRRDNGYMGPPLSPFVSSLHCKPISSNTFLPYLLHLSRFINFLVFPSTWDAPFLHSLCFTLLLKQNSFFFFLLVHHTIIHSIAYDDEEQPQLLCVVALLLLLSPFASSCSLPPHPW